MATYGRKTAHLRKLRVKTAAEDGSHTWLQTPALDLSGLSITNATSFTSLSGLIFAGDFACLYGSAQEEEVQDEGFSAQACRRTA